MGGAPIVGWGASSPWISAPKFHVFWSNRVSYEDYTGAYICANPQHIYSRPFYKGDVISITNSSKDTYHLMYISSYGNYNNQSSFYVTYHSNNTRSKSLIEIAAAYPNDTFRFFTIN